MPVMKQRAQYEQWTDFTKH